MTDETDAGITVLAAVDLAVAGHDIFLISSNTFDTYNWSRGCRRRCVPSVWLYFSQPGSESSLDPASVAS